MTSRGLGKDDMVKLAELIGLCATDFEAKAGLHPRRGYRAICEKYPIYNEIKA